MPAEKFYSVAREGADPVLTVAWGDGELWLNNEPIAPPMHGTGTYDLSQVNRLIKSLTRARHHLLERTYQAREKVNGERRRHLLTWVLGEGKFAIWICRSASEAVFLHRALAEEARARFELVTVHHARGNERISHINGACIVFAWASNPTSLRGRTADLVVLDEVDQLPVDGEPILADGAELVRIEALQRP